MRFRIVVTNLQSGIGITKGYRQYLTSGWRYVLPHGSRGVHGASVFLKEKLPDFVLLTEVEAGSRRTRHVSQLALLQEATGLSHAQFFSTTTLRNAINEGSAIASAYPIVNARTHPLPRAINPRVLGEVSVDVEGHTITIFVAHLALRARTRQAQIREIAAIIKQTPGPIILGGDFNERDHAAFSLFENLGLAHTCKPGYPSWRPAHALQVLFMSPEFEIETIENPVQLRYSDHLPLVAEVRLDPRKTKVPSTRSLRYH